MPAIQLESLAVFAGVFTEGWAVYTEQMMLDQGYGEGDLRLRLMQLKFYLRAVANQGAILGCDRFGIEHFNPLERRIETLLALLAEGYGDQIHLSHDAACFFEFFTGDAKFAAEEPSYLLIAQTVVPALLEAGVIQEPIDTMLIENPRRYFSGR